METTATSIPVKSSSRPATKIDWPLFTFTFWLSYLSVVFGVVYAFICVGFNWTVRASRPVVELVSFEKFLPAGFLGVGRIENLKPSNRGCIFSVFPFNH